MGEGGSWRVLWKTRVRDPRLSSEELLSFVCPGAAAPPRGTGIVPMGTNAYGYEEYLNEKDDSVIIRIPEGEFTMGSQEGSGSPDEHPAHVVHLGAYFIGKYEVTNEQYARFVSETGYRAAGRWRRYAGPGAEMHPVTDVTYDDAERYCAWAGLRLPTEAEWERAAGGTDGREFPWGKVWDRNRCNNSKMDFLRYAVLLAPTDELRGTVPVGVIREGASPCGAFDMAGNAWEWCRDWYDKDYYRTAPRANPVNEKRSFSRVWRGGSWVCGSLSYFRCASRGRLAPVNQFYHSGCGFRVCRDDL
jgi:formylglycine-generating enzyme required for sulfatase activity